MANAKTTIELNGKLYDARSGRIIDDTVPARPAVSPTPAQKRPVQHSGRVVDGFVRRPNVAAAQPAKVVAKPVQVTAPVETTVKKVKPAAQRAPVVHAKAKLQKSKTLMRPAVKKPKQIVEATTVPAKHTQLKKQDPTRELRAASVPKSTLVSRFNHSATPEATIVKRQASLPVSPAPPMTEQIGSKVAQLATSTEAQVKHSVDIIEESLRNATAHLEVFEDKAKKGFLERFGFKHKGANIASLTVAGFLLVGFFAYQNILNVEMRVAATRAGLSAHMPGYNPAGFSAANGVKSEPGKVAVTFTSNTDDKHYTLTQQASNWSSDSLLTNHVLASKQPYQTYQDEGKTIYITDNSNATWVNGGVWYKIDGNASLTSDQLLRIANSL